MANVKDKEEKKNAKVTVKATDMTEEMKKSAVQVCQSAMEGGGKEKEKDIAGHIKKNFSQLHGPTWHCIVGRNFGSFVTHETNGFIYLYVGKNAVLLFKAG